MMSMELSVDGALSVAEEKSGGYNVAMNSIVNGTRRPRTSEDFYLFCTYVLQYENYESAETEQSSRNATRSSNGRSPPLDSSGSSVNSDSTVADEQQRDRAVNMNMNTDRQAASGRVGGGDTTITVAASRLSNNDALELGDDEHNPNEDDDGDDHDDHDSFDLVTCFCGKPFAGRPMIECSICLTWIHLSCARIKKTNIPDVFHCALCKSGGSGATGRRTTRPSPSAHAHPTTPSQSAPPSATIAPPPGSTSPITLMDRHRDRSASPTGHTYHIDKAIKRPKRTSPTVLQGV